MSRNACPPAAQMATLIEGASAPHEREMLLAHLRDCEDCHEVFVEGAEFFEASAGSQALAPAARAATVARTPPWLPLAAAALVAVGTAVFFASLRGAASRAPLLTAHVAPTPASNATPPAVAGEPVGALATLAADSVEPIEWLEHAPWDRTDARFSFAGGLSGRAVIVGMHLAARGRACEIRSRVLRTRALTRIARSLERQGLGALRTDCAVPVVPAGSDAGWQQIGADVERWRIALVERRADGLSAQRARKLARSLATLRAEPALRRAAAQLESTLAAPGVGFELAGEALDELIELLCA